MPLTALSKGNIRSVAKDSIGGNVVAILLRQAMRLQGMRRQARFDQRRAEMAQMRPEYHPPTIFVAGVPVTSRQQEAYTFQADATRLPVESGAILSDHIILQPLKIDMDFEVSNWEEGRAEYALTLLEDIWRLRVQLDLLTEHKKIPNMCMINLQADNSAPRWGRLAFRATFQSIHPVTLETIGTPPEKVQPTEKTGGPDTSLSAETAVESRNQKPQRSALKGLFSD